MTLEQDEANIVEEVNSQEIPEIVDDVPEPVQEQAAGNQLQINLCYEINI